GAKPEKIVISCRTRTSGDRACQRHRGQGGAGRPAVGLGGVLRGHGMVLSERASAYCDGGRLRRLTSRQIRRLGQRFAPPHGSSVSDLVSHRRLVRRPFPQVIPRSAEGFTLSPGGHLHADFPAPIGLLFPALRVLVWVTFTASAGCR